MLQPMAILSKLDRLCQRSLMSTQRTSSAGRLDSPYLIGKCSSNRLKIKVAHTADFVVIGCVPIRGKKAVRALLLDEKHQGRLVYKGKVGSGLTRRQHQDFFGKLTKAPKFQEPVDCPSGSI
jgi:ATP-dependent DNA ligase